MRITKTIVCAGTCLLIASPNRALAQSAPEKLLVGDVKVQTIRSYSGTEPLPKPDLIEVETFRVPADVIAIDDSASSRLLARRLALEGKTPDTTPEAVAQHVHKSFTESLINELQKTALPVDTKPSADTSSVQYRLILAGEFTRIDEGNRSKRVMIGFGRGATDVQARVTVSLAKGDYRPTLVSEFKLNSESGKKPGAATTMGVGAAAAGVATGSVGDKKATVEADASRMAKAIARQIQELLAEQNWLPTQPASAK